MKILHIYGLGDTSLLLADGMNELGVDAHVLLSNKQFKTQLPAWMREYPSLKDKIHLHHSEDQLDPQTYIQMGKFANSFDFLICHAPSYTNYAMFKKPFYIWDGGASHFIWREKEVSETLTYDREAARRAYFKAEGIFINDIDCLYSDRFRYPKRLHKKSIPMPLPVDLQTFYPQYSAKMEWTLDKGKQIASKFTVEKDDKFLIYFPSRQIQEYKGVLDVIKGLQLFYLFEKNIRIWIANYGRDVDITKAKVKEYGLESVTEFVKPVPKQEFARMLSMADVVIDQLLLGAYGGVSAQAMACETPPICNVHQPWYEEHYEHVPVLYAKTPFDVQAQLKKALDFKKRDWKGFGQAGRRFVEKWHDHKKVAKRVLEVILEPEQYGDRPIDLWDENNV